MTVRSLALGLVVVCTLTGCSGAGDEPSGDGPASTTGTPAATPAPGSAAATTAPGATLALGESGTVAWQVDGATTGVVDLVVSQVQRKGPAVLAGWVPADQVADATPYFVRASVTNAGDTGLGGAALPLYLRGSGGVLTPAATFGSTYPRCPSTPLPDPFAPGEQAAICLVYTLEPGVEPDAMTFQPTDTEPGVAWEVR